MHHFIFPNQDTWVSSGSSNIDGESFKDQNFGRDQILEIKKEFFNNTFDYPTRALVQFSGTEFNELSKSVADGTIASDAKYYLRLFEAEGNAELTEEYKLAIQPISQSWTEGTGKFGDKPKNTNGCSWENKSNPMGGTEIQWSTQTSVGSDYAKASFTISSEIPSSSAHELTINGIDFVPVEDASLFDNSSTERYVTITTNIDTFGKNLSDAIGVASSLTNVSASYIDDSNTLVLSGSVAGTVGNVSITTSSISVNNQTPFLLAGTTALADGTDTTSGISGNGPSILNISQSEQSFTNQSPDVDVEITDMVNSWLNGTIDNYGMQIRFSGSQETDSETFGHLKFFSRNTHTIYSPKLEVRWDDSSFSTGELNELTMSGLADNFLYMKGLRESYKVGERVKFRVGARKRYIQKTFSNSVQTVTGSFITEGKGFYAIKDVATDEFIVPFEDNQDVSYTKLSCDSDSNYFIQYLDGFYPDRVYKILLKLKYDDGQEQIFDNDFEFIVKRK